MPVRPRPMMVKRGAPPSPPPPPPAPLSVQMDGGGTQFISGPGTANFGFTISASGGDGGPYTFNVGFGDQVGFAVSFSLPLTVSNGGTASSFASGGAHDSSGNSGGSNSAFYQLVSNPV